MPAELQYFKSTPLFLEIHQNFYDPIAYLD